MPYPGTKKISPSLGYPEGFQKIITHPPGDGGYDIPKMAFTGRDPRGITGPHTGRGPGLASLVTLWTYGHYNHRHLLWVTGHHQKCWLDKQTIEITQKDFDVDKLYSWLKNDHIVTYVWSDIFNEIQTYTWMYFLTKIYFSFCST